MRTSPTIPWDTQRSDELDQIHWYHSLLSMLFITRLFVCTRSESCWQNRFYDWIYGVDLFHMKLSCPSKCLKHRTASPWKEVSVGTQMDYVFHLECRLIFLFLNLRLLEHLVLSNKSPVVAILVLSNKSPGVRKLIYMFIMEKQKIMMVIGILNFTLIWQLSFP